MTFWFLHCPDLLNGNMFLLVRLFSALPLALWKQEPVWGFLRCNSWSVLKRIDEAMCSFPDCYFFK